MSAFSKSAQVIPDKAMSRSLRNLPLDGLNMAPGEISPVIGRIR